MCGSLHAFRHAGVAVSKSTVSFHAALLPLHHAADEFWPLTKKVVLLIVLPWLPPSSGKLQFEDSLQHFEILQSSMYNPFKLSFE